MPAFHLNPNILHVIQTPKEVVLFLTGRIRHIWLNVPHSANPKPAWYGKSVGHYEGDTLVVDTIGFNGKTFAEYLPHAAHRQAARGRALSPDRRRQHARSGFHRRGSRRLLSALVRHPQPPPRGQSEGLRPVEFDCSAANDDYFNIGLEPVPTAEKTEF